MRAGDDKQVGIACGETVGAEAGDQRAKPVLPAQRFIDGKAFEQLSRCAAAAEQRLIGRENAKRTLDVVLQLQAVRMQKLLERFPLGQKGKLQRADLIVLHKYLPARISKKRPVSALPAGRRLCASFNLEGSRAMAKGRKPLPCLDGKSGDQRLIWRITSITLPSRYSTMQATLSVVSIGAGTPVSDSASCCSSSIVTSLRLVFSRSSFSSA